MDTFGGCKNLKKARVSLNTLLPREDDGTYNGVHSLFLNCTSLSVIEVDFTSWDGFDTLVGWLEGVSPRGVFIKSSALPAEYGEYRIPHNWQVVNK